MNATQDSVDSKKLEEVAADLFASVQKFELQQVFAHSLFFLIAAVSTFLEDGFDSLVLAVMAIALEIRAIWLKVIAHRRTLMAHDFHRALFLVRAYDVAPGDFDFGYLLSKLPRLRPVRARPNGDESATFDFAAIDSSPGSERLKWMVHENAYFNAALYDECIKASVRWLVLVFSMGVLVSALIVPTIGSADLEFKIVRVFLLMFTAHVLIEQIEKAIAWWHGAQIMKEVEAELSRKRDVEHSKMLWLFSTYHICIVCTPEMFKSVYKSQRETLNVGWAARRASLLKDWSPR